MLEVKKLYKSYGSRFSLHIENLVFKNSGVVSILGPNGSGKTTFLKVLLSLVIPNDSLIIYKNKEINIDFDFKKNLGYMPQTAIYPENLKVKEIIEISKSLKNGTAEHDYELYEEYRIDKVLETRFSALSQGTKQKIAAAIVFMFGSRVLILDEPTAGLDPYASEILKKKIVKEKDKRLILFTTHIMSDAAELSDRIVFLHEGRISFDREFTEEEGITDSKELVSEITKYFSK